MRPSLTSLILCLTLLSAGSPQSYAQHQSHLAPPKRTIPAVKTTTPPVIDGKIDDAAWKDAPLLTDFVDLRDDEIAEFGTKAWILYDDEFLYVAYEVMQPKDTIVANVFKYDRIEMRFEDYIQLGIDTFHDGAQAYLFLISPLGTRWDAREGLFDRNQSWDADWDAQTTILEDRWIAELRIPIGVMHHDQKEGESFGLNIRRRYAKENASFHWNFDPNAGFSGRATGPKFVADFGVMENIDLSNMKVQQAPKIETYVSSTTSERQGGNTHTRMSTGLDADLRINSHWTTQFSVNPDFGEIAADEGDVQNRDTARFLFERRTFFNEGAELFRSPTTIYDSRQIKDFDAAAKIVGNGSNWTMASLVLRGEGTRSGEDADMLVSRYSQTISDNLKLGATLIGVDRKVGDNITFGVDSRYEFTPSTVWTTQYVSMIGQNAIDADVSDATHEVQGHQIYTELEWGTQPWTFELTYRDISDNFNPDLAFIPRKDVRGPGLEIGYSETYDNAVLESIFAQIEFQHFTNHDDQTVLRDYFGYAGLSFQNEWDLNFRFKDNFHIPYDNTEYAIGTTYNRQDRYKSWRAEYAIGEFQEIEYDQYSLTKPFKITNRWTNDITSTLRQEDRDGGNNNVWLWSVESEYTAKWEGRIKLTLEATSDRAYKRTLLFAYEEVKDWDFFFVINDFRDDENFFEEVNRSIYFKFIYHW
jgi:hypothetical protein